jgi:hypothetical protein
MTGLHRIAILAIVALALSAVTATAAPAKLDPALQAKLDRLAPGETVAVSIWLDVPPLHASRTGSHTRYLARVWRYMSEKQRGVVAALVRMGVRARAATYSPIVFADLTRRQVLAIERRTDVKKIYGPDEYSLTG